MSTVEEIRFRKERLIDFLKGQIEVFQETKKEIKRNSTYHQDIARICDYLGEELNKLENMEESENELEAIEELKEIAAYLLTYLDYEEALLQKKHKANKIGLGIALVFTVSIMAVLFTYIKVNTL